MKVYPVGSEVPPPRRCTDKWRYMMKLVISFCHFAKVHKNLNASYT